jgi:hypothetical protein
MSSQKVDNNALGSYLVTESTRPGTGGTVQHIRQDGATAATTQSFIIAIGNSANVLPANDKRLSASIYLNSATTVFVRYGAAPDASTFKLKLRGADSYFELPQPVYTGDVFVFSPTASATVLAAEETGDYI